MCQPTALKVPLSRVLKNVMSDGLSRQILPKKRSLWVINEHFEAEFNALRPSAIVFQHPVRPRPQGSSTLSLAYSFIFDMKILSDL